MPLNLTFLKKNPANSSAYMSQLHYAFKSIETCDYQVGLNENLEFYFSASDSLRALPDTHYFRNSSSDELNSFKRHDYFTDMDTEYSLLQDVEFDLANSNLEERSTYINEKEKNMLNLRHLKSLCAWDKKMLQMLAQASAKNKRASSQVPCHFSLPSAIALMNNKTDCMNLTADDVRAFLAVCQQCHPLQKSGILYAAAEDSKQKSDIIDLLTKNDPVSKFIRSPLVSENICFKKNLMHMVYEYLVDNQFMASKSGSSNVKVAALLIMNSERTPKKNATSLKKAPKDLLYDSEFVFEFYMNEYHKKSFDDKLTKVSGLNLMGIREQAAMRLISQEMSLVALAIILIVIATLLYLKSVMISIMINLGVGMSVGVSFFAYRIVFDIDLFPFLNMMAAFLLLGKFSTQNCSQIISKIKNIFKCFKI